MTHAFYFRVYGNAFYFPLCGEWNTKGAMKTDYLWFLNQTFSMNFTHLVHIVLHILCIMPYNVNNISPEQNRNSGPNKTQIIDVRMSEMSALIPTRICPEQQATSHREEGGGWVEAAASVPFCRGSLMSVGVPFHWRGAC